MILQNIKIFSVLLCSFFVSANLFSAELPIGQVYGAGLTYKKHIKDAGERFQKDGPPIFIKGQRSLLLAEKLQNVATPSDAIVYSELEALEPGLPAKIQKDFDEFPLMFDYEAEVGLYFTRDVKASEFNTASLKNAVALFSANDLTLRSIQVLGDKQRNVYDYWSVAKSFEHFLPVSMPRAVSDFSLTKWPNLSVRLWVNGEIRQNETMADMAYSPKQVLQALTRYTGSVIPSGTVFITGTPTGTAFKVSWFKRFIANFLFWARMFKFKMVANSAAKDPNYLKVGDEVIVEVQGVGQNRIKIVK
ncbi:MAG: fumarylacetoacetate hydrolase family protein [Bdellovibrionota bacterium]